MTKTKVAETEPVGTESDVSEPEKVPGKSKKESAPVKPRHLISLAEYKTVSRHDVTSVLESGFRVWMQTEKKQPLSSRVESEWNNLFVEYLKS